MLTRADLFRREDKGESDEDEKLCAKHKYGTRSMVKMVKKAKQATPPETNVV